MEIPLEDQFVEQAAPAPQAQPQRAAAPAGRTRQPPSIPRRRPRPQQEAFEDEESLRGSRRPQRPEEAPAVGTVERYSHKNEDGSFTFGYIAEDGSFREETRGVDCITRGKYGYIDPDGKRREFTYVSGLPCEIGEEGELEDDDDLQEFQQDPIDPNERFRTSQVLTYKGEFTNDVGKVQNCLFFQKKLVFPLGNFCF